MQGVTQFALDAVETKVKQGPEVNVQGLGDGDQALVFGGLLVPLAGKDGEGAEDDGSLPTLGLVEGRRVLDEILLPEPVLQDLIELDGVLVGKRICREGCATYREWGCHSHSRAWGRNLTGAVAAF